MVPDVSHHPLSRADGSAVFTSHLHSVLAAVNGPLEVQRRDELPEEAAIEVNVRPPVGVGSPRERWLESIVSAVLRRVLLVHLHPRTLIQITLQIVQEPAPKLKRAVKDISVLPSLLNAAFLALVDGGLPLATTMSAALVSVDDRGAATADPAVQELAASRSVHALAYDRHGDLLLNESLGDLDFDGWESVADTARKACMSSMASTSEDVEMHDDAAEAVPWMRQELEERAKKAGVWSETS